MKLFGNANYSVYIYARDHPPPHCHVKLSDGSEICVTLPLLEPMYGAKLDKVIFTDLLENLEDMVTVWGEFHPSRR